MSVLIYIFNLSIIIGIVIPLLNVLTGWFGSFFGASVDADFDVAPDIDLDFGVDASVDLSTDVSMDIGSDAGAATNVGSSAVIPFNFMCLCLFLVVFGAVGHMIRHLMTNTLLMVLLLVGCAVVAALAYMSMYRLLILRLKRSDSGALSYRALRGKSAEVTLTLKADSIGTISLRDSTGAAISFRAKIDADLKDQLPKEIPKGEKVIITEVDSVNKLCYVSLPFYKFQDKNDNIKLGE